MTTIAEARASRFDLPMWPVLFVPWAFPILWLTGSTVPAAAVVTVFMVIVLSRARSIALPGPVLALVGFVLWTILCVSMIDEFTRALGYVFRFVSLAYVTVSVLYLVNVRRFDRAQVLRALTFVWFFSIAGGYLGMLAPTLRIPTIVGALLPGSLATNDYVQDLFNPAVAEVQTPWGAAQAFIRPSAPYAYANSWGMAMIILTPVAIATAIATRRLGARIAIIVGLVAMVPPALATSNRMMFVGFGLAAAYVVARMAMRNKALPVIISVLAGLVAVPTLIASGLTQQVEARAQYGSASSRFELYAETITRTLRSPILGYGAPRPSQEVLGISVGTQGQIWAVMFAYGFVGLALFLGFYWGTIAYAWQARDDVDIVLHGGLIAAGASMFIYGLDIMQLLAVSLVAATLIRRRQRRPGDR